MLYVHSSFNPGPWPLQVDILYQLDLPEEAEALLADLAQRMNRWEGGRGGRQGRGGARGKGGGAGGERPCWLTWPRG